MTAAAGKTGRETTLQLLAREYPVRALVRRADERSEELRRAGADVVVGSLEELDDLERCLIDVQRAYFCPPLEPGALRKTALFAVAARHVHLEVVVELSQWVVDPGHPAIHAREKWLAHDLLSRTSDLDVITINPGWFADNYMASLESITQFGLMALPLGDGLNAPPSNEDIARVIVAMLTRPEGHIGHRYRPTGPRLLSPEQIAAAYGRVLGRPVKYRDVPRAMFLRAAAALGFSDFVILQLDAFVQEYQRNSFGVGAPTDVVREFGGSVPEEFEAIVARYVARSPASRRTLGAQLAASANLLRTLMRPNVDLEAIAERLGLPSPAAGTLAADSTNWRASTLDRTDVNHRNLQ